ncbi:transcriptional regulator CynR [Aliifodinibius sp. S!AR15-10]|uniref:transcriptional regulator CynR n=1 Tax=Aliifodinibius sp. S!AR15-10 TaxID=2950437 RepID=UPI0028615B09|nr:transcriptional regulator CynR [Aliifodinibius sp. S!AR15-10]MDR8394479.1 transcriptional regulator CynR [Aliifodinibius sp. S!AR15-10]
MELRQLKYLLSIAEEGTFTAAADKLFISQSALSQQVKRMEEELGVPLFDRSRNRLQFTEAGELLHQRAKRIVKEVDEAKQAIDELEQLYRGTLKIGVVQTVNAYLIPHVVSSFSSQYPDVGLKLEELSAPQVEKKLHEHELDLGISFHPADYPELGFNGLFDEELLLIINGQHSLTDKEVIDVAELDRQKLILLSEGYCTRRIWDRCAMEAGIEPDVAIEMNTIGGLLSALEGNSTAGTILPALTMKMKAAEQLKSVRIKNPTPKRTVGLLWRNGGYRSKAARKFADILQHKVDEI